MHIDIDGRLLEVPPLLEANLAGQLFQLIADGLYPSIPMPIRQAIKVYARGELLKLEKRLNAAGYNGTSVRPPTGADPTLHYMRMMFVNGLKGLDGAILLIDTAEGTDTVTAFALSIPDNRESGGPLLTGGNERERQDVGDESLGQASGEAVPDA